MFPPAAGERRALAAAARASAARWLQPEAALRPLRAHRAEEPGCPGRGDGGRGSGLEGVPAFGTPEGEGKGNPGEWEPAPPQPPSRGAAPWAC